ncbi:hypothetical protein ACA910_018325 [Epithemia clementina (nom. ined.)]
MTTTATETTSTSSTSYRCTTATASVRVVPNSTLFVSEPEPFWFGNERNPKNDPAWTNGNWLKSRFHFSFAEYNNVKNSDFGVLRVMNDDLVQPHRGFGTHPHSNMEIITYIVNGQLTHQDSMGTKESLGRGSIQFMTAGTGVRHSEFNHGDTPLRFIQTWIKPNRSGLSPNYGSYRGDTAEAMGQRRNKLQHLVSNVEKQGATKEGTPVHVNQEVNAFASEMELGQKVVHELPAGHQAYLLCVEGGVKVNGEALDRYDACEIQGLAHAPTSITIEATKTEASENGNLAHVLLFTMKQVKGSGRRDL